MSDDDDDEYFSDLTELPSDEEYEGTPSQQKKGKKKAESTYQLRNPLRVPRATTYAAQALFDQMDDDDGDPDIDVNPEYQRDVVWPDAKQISLIDSIFRNFYVPPVIFVCHQREDGSEKKVCIDGKQRLTSIRRFMDGQIPHKDALTFEKWWYKSLPGQKGRKILPEHLRRAFANKQIVCVEYQDITEDDEREVFQRVQLGMALTPAEKLQVINTDRAAFVRALAHNHTKDGGLSPEYLEWDTKRAADFRCLAQALWLLDRWGAELRTIASMQQLEKFLSNEEPFEPSFQADMEDTFAIFSELTQDKNLNKPFKTPAKVSPVEFIGVAMLIGVLRTKLSMKQLSSAIGLLRKGVREVHVDIRMNGTVAKTLIGIIRGMKVSQFAQDGGPVASKRNGASSGSKRKRVVEDDDNEAGDMDVDDEEDEDEGDDGEYAQRRRAPKKTKSVPSTAAPKTKQKKPPSLKVKEERQASPKVPPPSLPSSSTNRLTQLRATIDNAGAAPMRPPSLPSLTSRVTSASSQPSTPQLPSPGQTFRFPSSLGAVTGNGPPHTSTSSYIHSLQQAHMQATQSSAGSRSGSGTADPARQGATGEGGGGSNYR